MVFREIIANIALTMKHLQLMIWLLSALLCAIAGAQSSLSCYSQTSQRQILDTYNFSPISISDGLPSNYINYIYKDKQGFLWLCTHNGLSRYDGYSFVNYNVSSSPIRLRSNFVNQVCEDFCHRLWIGSEAGLSLLDLKNNRLKKVEYKHFVGEDLSKEPVWFIVADKRQSIWLATQTNLYHATFDALGNISRCTMLRSKYARHSSSITSLRLIGNQIWVGYNHSLYKVVSENASLIFLQPVIKGFCLDNQNSVCAFDVCKDEIWMASVRGLYQYSRNTHLLKSYPINGTSLAVMKDKKLVVGSQRGLHFYDRAHDSFVEVGKTRITDENVINCSFVRCLFADHSILWIGTEIGGMNKMENRTLRLRIYANSNDHANLSDNPVSCIYEDAFHNLWVGNVGQGMNVRYKDSDTFYDISNNATIYDITQDDRGNLWMATWGGGLIYTKLTARPNSVGKHFTTENSDIRNNFVESVCFDRLNDGVWAGTAEGLSFYDIPNGQFRSIPLPTDVIPNNSVTDLHIDRQQRLWVGTHHGLIVLDLFSFAKRHTSVSFKYLPYKLDRPQSQLIDKICCIFEASDGSIWVGSDGYGLYRLVNQTGGYHFVNYDTRNGLCDNTVLGIVEDAKRQLWMITNNGLSCFNRHNRSFTNYYSEDGLLTNQFYKKAFCRASDNVLYFGGINGMVGLTPVQSSHVYHSHKVVFTSLMVQDNNIVQGENEYIDENIPLAKGIHLHESDKSFSLNFSSLDFANAGKLKYYYRLKGFDDRWVACEQGRPVANYTNLKAGHYIFQVKVKNPSSVGESNITEIPIIVSPFFYKTWWFWTLIFIVIIISSFYWYQWRISSLKEQREILTEKVKERTLALEEKMGVLSQQNVTLTKQKQQLIELSRRIQEMTDDKISFFTNITHEFRTPITLMLGPLANALKHVQNPIAKEQLDIVDRNSKSLLSLVNQLLDFRKVESGRIAIHKTYNDLLRFINNVVIPFKAFAKDRQIDVRCIIHASHNFYLYDEEWMQKVMVNLLSNAVKFTPNGGVVNVYVYTFADTKGRNQAYIAVSDNGVGILSDDLEKIFERFYQSRRHIRYNTAVQSGTGIGLYVCKRIVNEHGGNIYARNNRGAGSTFRVLMPMDKGDVVTAKVQLEEPQEMTKPLSVQKESSDRKNILVVDDNSDMRTYVRSILSPYYNVIESEDGESALRILGMKNIDFIVSDLMMPGIDGIELSRRIKENLNISHIPILILTAKSSAEAKLESFRIGVDEYIQKPFSEELLLVRIRNIFKSREINQQQFDLQMNPDLLHVNEETRDSKFLKTLMTVIDEHYKDSDFDVVQFASEMNMSKTLLNQKMQSLIGQSISKFISSYRLKKAQTLVEINKINKNMNVSEIAYEVGFNDPKYFSRCYLKKYGVLPSVSI